MQSLQVDLGERSYPIYIGSGLLDRGELFAPHIQGRQVAVVSNQTVAALYLDDSLVTDAEIKRILNLAKGKKKYVAAVADLEAGKATSRGRYVTVLSPTSNASRRTGR